MPLAAIVAFALLPIANKLPTAMETANAILNFMYLSLEGGRRWIRGSPKMISRQAGVLPVAPACSVP
jgi:hypothetical protein